MIFYLIENRMGFERPINEGNRRDMEVEKDKYLMASSHIEEGSYLDALVAKANYYIVAKEDWDLSHCPILPVDHS